MFLDIHHCDLNKTTLANQFNMGTQIWYSIQMTIVGIVVMILGSVFCILYRYQTDPILLTMVLQQVMGVNGNMIGLLHSMANMEKTMISVQRCFNMYEVP